MMPFMSKLLEYSSSRMSDCVSSGSFSTSVSTMTLCLGLSITPGRVESSASAHKQQPHNRAVNKKVVLIVVFFVFKYSVYFSG